MINLTDRIMVLKSEGLAAAVLEGIEAVQSHLESRYGKPPVQVIWDSPHGFQYLFSAKNIPPTPEFDESFLNTLLDLSALNSRNEGIGRLFEALATCLNNVRPPACAIGSIKQGIKLLLVELWQRQILLLPTVFSPGSHFEPVPIKHELYEFIKSSEKAVDLKEVSKPSFNGTDGQRLSGYMHRVLQAASWRSAEDVNLYEYADLHRAQRQAVAGGYPYAMSTSPIPWFLFLVELHKAFPERVTYSENDLKNYSLWMHKRDGLPQSFTDFVENPQKLKELLPKRKKKSSTNNNDSLVKFEGLGSSGFHDDALSYFKDFIGRARGGLDWLESEPRYPGREHVTLEGGVASWRKAFNAYLHYRRNVKGYESDYDVNVSLNILGDYLFLYLPWWKEIYPGSIIPIPLAPKDFVRYSYVARSSDEPIDQFPITFPEMLKLRRITTDSQYSALKCIQLFFRFVESHFSEDAEIAGPKFRNPFFDEFDLPRVSKRTKTSKVVFPKNSYGYLVHYGYAIEAFGQYMQELCMSGAIDVAQLRGYQKKLWIDVESFGFVPFVQFRGKISPIKRIPNVFTWMSRNFKVAGAPSVEKYVPHLTVLRLLIAAIEVGLRLAGLRWLDRRTWDKENRGSPDISEFSFQATDKYIYSLHVNTDKTKNEAWNTNIVFRVRALLQREEAFQLSVDEPHMSTEVPYEKREHSRFGNILPLFRACSSPGPISENVYQDYWVLFLTGFQEIYSNILGHQVLFVKVCSSSKESEPPKEVVGTDDARYCPVSILAINTPHACRATYATNRQGLLETSDIALQLGHNDVTVTEYYQSPRTEDLQERLEATDKAIFNDYQQFEQSGSSYIRPDKQESALVRSFKANRDATLKQFGFMPPLTLWQTAESKNLDEDEIEELRNGPMSLIRFHETHICPVGDECPADVVEAIGGLQRCGICPIALKCVDHLPPIAAKKNLLLERIRYQLRQRDALEADGELTAAENLWEAIELDANEWIGWQFSEEVLAKSFEKLNFSDQEVVYHSEQPEIVKQHLLRVVKNSGQVEFLLKRIAEANAYPSMQTPQVQAVAVNIRRRLMAGSAGPELMTDLPGPADVAIASGLLKTVMRTQNLSLADMSKKLESDTVALPRTSHLRIAGGHD